jgi:signal transduction histidine kinase
VQIIDTTEVRLFTQRLSERLRQLRAQSVLESSAPDLLLPRLVVDLESAEELRIADEELRVQNEELRDNAEMLEAEHQRVQRLFDLAPGPLLTTDAFGTIRDMNRAAARLLGVPRGQLHRKPLAALVVDSASELRAHLTALARLESPPEVRIKLRPREGDPIEVSARTVAVPATASSSEEIIWSFTPDPRPPRAAGRDREDGAGAGARLEEMSERLQHAERAASDRARAMADLSHEFRTPLHSILGYAELLLEGIPESIPDACRAYVRSITQAASHLSGVVEDMLSLHQLDDPQHAPQLEDVAVGDCVLECAMILRGRAETAGLVLEVRAAEGLMARTDRRKLRQILINLLGNAIKFTRQGGVTVTAERAAGRILLSVRDTGPGIDPLEVPHIFEPFWRGDEAVRNNTEGAGLGLALVRSLVSRIGGVLEIETAPDAGTTFRISLPAASES